MNTLTAPGRANVAVPAGFDRILEWEAGVGATAIRNVPNTLAVFATHFPRKPILPGVLMLESMAALAAALCDKDRPERWRLTSVAGVRFRHFVGPGDEVALRVRLLERATDEVRFTAEALVADRTVATARTFTLTSVEGA